MNEMPNLVFRDFVPGDLNDIPQVFFALNNSLSKVEGKGIVLLNLDKIRLTNTFRSSLSSFLKSNAHKISCTALEGVERGVRRIIMDTTGYPFYYSVDREDSLEWLNSLEKE